MTVTASERSAATPSRLYRVHDVIEERLIPLSRARIYELIRSGRLHSVKEGRTRLIPDTAIHEYITLLEKEAQDGGR